MKIIAADNFNRDSVSERVVAQDLTQAEAEKKLRDLEATETDDGPWWHRIEPDDYVPYRWEL